MNSPAKGTVYNSEIIDEPSVFYFYDQIPQPILSMDDDVHAFPPSSIIASMHIRTKEAAATSYQWMIQQRTANPS